jgi:hypothetical protein
MDNVKELQKIKGVGTATAKKLVAAGFDSPSRIAAATAAELQAVPGLQGHMVPALQEEAARLCGEAPPPTGVSQEGLLLRIGRLKGALANLETDIQARFPSEGEEKRAQKPLREIHRFLKTLARMEATLAEQLQYFAKRLTKADARLSHIREEKLEKMRDGLKQARKDLEKVFE